MDGGHAIAFALVLLLTGLVLRFLWSLAVALVAFAIPTYAAVVIGWLTGTLLHSASLGLAAAVLTFGILRTVVVFVIVLGARWMWSLAGALLARRGSTY